MIASYLFYPYVRPDGWGAPLLGVGWTLNYEVFFYTLFGLLVFLQRRAVVAVIAALFCVLIAIRYFYADLPNPFAYWFNPLIIEFVFGMVIALAYREGVRLPMWLVWTLVASGLAVLGWSWSQAHFFDPGAWLRVAVWGLPALAIVGGYALAVKPVPQNLFWRVTGFLGDASYSIYLVHTLALGVPRLVLGRFIDPASAPWFYLGADRAGDGDPAADRLRLRREADHRDPAAQDRGTPAPAGRCGRVARDRAVAAPFIPPL